MAGKAIPSSSSKYQCIVCSFVGNDKSKLHGHLESDHGSQKFLWCKWCGKISECIDDFFVHLENNLCDEVYQLACGFEGCNFVDTQPPHFVAHFKSSHRGKPLIPCKFCKRLFTLHQCLIQHLQSDCCNKQRTNKPSKSSSASQPTTSQAKSPSKLSPPQHSTNVKTTAGHSTNVKSTAGTSTAKESTKVNETKQKKRKKTEPKVTVKKKKLFETELEHSDSDVDDPTWRISEEDKKAVEKLRGDRPKKNSIQNKNEKTKDTESSGSQSDVDDPTPRIPEDNKAVEKPRTDRPKKNSIQIKNDKSKDTESSGSHSDVDDPTSRIPEEDNSAVEKPRRDRPKKNSIQITNDKAKDTESSGSHSDVDDPTSKIPEDNEAVEKARRGRPKKNSIQFKNDEVKDTESSVSHEIDENATDNVKEPACETYNTWKEWYQKINELKSAESLKELLEPENITNFYKCMHKSCSFSSQSKLHFVSHIQNSEHDKIHRCCYCLLTFDDVDKYIQHLLTKHRERRFQCTTCLYRSSSKAHAKLHIKTGHVTEKSGIVNCEKVEILEDGTTLTPSAVVIGKRNRYSCCLSGCRYNTLITNSFVKHFSDKHPKLLYYPCCFCAYKSSDLSVFLKHFQEHDIFDFECFYCPFGSEKSEDVLLHMSINHPDITMQVLSRKTNDDITKEWLQKKQENNGNKQSHNLTSTSKNAKRSCAVVESAAENGANENCKSNKSLKLTPKGRTTTERQFINSNSAENSTDGDSETDKAMKLTAMKCTRTESDVLYPEANSTNGDSEVKNIPLAADDSTAEHEFQKSDDDENDVSEESGPAMESTTTESDDLYHEANTANGDSELNNIMPVAADDSTANEHEVRKSVDDENDDSYDDYESTDHDLLKSSANTNGNSNSTTSACSYDREIDYENRSTDIARFRFDVAPKCTSVNSKTYNFVKSTDSSRDVDGVFYRTFDNTIDFSVSENTSIDGFSTYGQKPDNSNLRDVYLFTNGVKISLRDCKMLLKRPKIVVLDIRRSYF